jgi:hypothetical protein
VSARKRTFPDPEGTPSPSLIRVPAGVGHQLMLLREGDRRYYAPDRLEAVWEVGALRLTARVRLDRGAGPPVVDGGDIGGGDGPEGPEGHQEDLREAAGILTTPNLADIVYYAFLNALAPIQIMGRSSADREDLERHELAAEIYNSGPRRGAAQRVADHFGISRTGAYHLINKAKGEGLIAEE